MRLALAAICSGVMLLLPSGVFATVVESDPGGFAVTVERTLGPDTPDARQALWSLLIAPDRWWSPAHTWSGDASNLSLEAKVGGCWCEKLKDGGMVEHARVLLVEPQHRLLLRGELGPLQHMAVTGKMEMAIGATSGKTSVTFSYAVGGYGLHDSPGLAKAVDAVLSEQADRLVKAATAR